MYMLPCFELPFPVAFLRTSMIALKSRKLRRRVTISLKKSIVPASTIVLGYSETLYPNTLKMIERFVVCL